MVEKTFRSGNMPKPVPMKLFSNWEVEKTSSNCIQRLCCLTLNRLVLKTDDTEPVYIAVSMETSKRILRSNEICLPPSGHIDTNLDLSFSLQYPHYMKRNTNWLKVVLQRKRYKNKALTSYKTFATGRVDMKCILQHGMEKELPMYPHNEDPSHMGVPPSLPPIAHVCIQSLVSLPVKEGSEQSRCTQDSQGISKNFRHSDRHRKKANNSDHSPNCDISDDDDSSTQDDLSDSEPNEPKKIYSKFMSHSTRPGAFSKPLKQKFVSLLNRLKTKNEEDSEHETNEAELAAENCEIADLLDEIEKFRSDSDPDNDSLSIQSIPKPQLRPYFDGASQKESQINESSNRQSDDTSEGFTVSRVYL